jgi:uncharacterized protein with FMN-binding domain
MNRDQKIQVMAATAGVSLLSLAVTAGVTLQAITSNDNYNNGTYTAKISYDAHRHQESIEVSITIEDGKIITVSNVHSGNDHESVEYQNSFEQNIESTVVGKNLDDVALSRIGGASDTTEAFMKAITQIKQDAKG